MSTFNGIVHEFPDIRIDYFRHVASAPSPLACFLSHVHSDHLAGLESLRSPFIYCSGATREILLRLERYPCRIDYAKGILEARQQTYRHLSKVLKPLPLDTPILIELRPGYQIQVTLMDANHCPGAVMFLIEDENSAILYTGDIRAEAWFVNSLARNPLLMAYTSGLRRLDKIYLDTSFTSNIAFQTKAEGLAELLSKVSEYPRDTIFHLQAWTYGYEDVWIALSNALGSAIHVDDYKMRIYRSLRKRSPDKQFTSDLHLTHEAPALVGFMCGNSTNPGCLTSDIEVKLHSCEKGNMCEVARRPGVVSIQPIIAHLSATEDLKEAGVGGGGDDLEREAELEFLSAEDMTALLEMVASSAEAPQLSLDDLKKRLENSASTGRHLVLDLEISAFGDDFATDLQQALRTMVGKSKPGPKLDLQEGLLVHLPKVIHFPYSRHSSYPELCEFVNLFKPKDIWPCTVDNSSWFRNGTTIQSLFGDYCSSTDYLHDHIMEELAKEQNGPQDSQAADSQMPPSSGPRLDSSPIISASVHNTPDRDISPKFNNESPPGSMATTTPRFPRCISHLPESQKHHSPHERVQTIDLALQDALYETEDSSEFNAELQTKRMFNNFQDDGEDPEESQLTQRSFASCPSKGHSAVRHEAFGRMLSNADNGVPFLIPLISTDDNHSKPELELGS